MQNWEIIACPFLTFTSADQYRRV